MEWVTTAWNYLADFLNSNFTAALAGAFAGAMAARQIEGRAIRLTSLQQELRATNAAITLAFLICNTAINLKAQFVKDVHREYADLKRRYAITKLQGRAEAATSPFVIEMDLREIAMPQFPVEVLRAQVFEKVSAVHRPLALAVQVESSVLSLSGTLHKRHELIERARRAGSDDPIIQAMYLGEPYGTGHRSSEFPDSVDGLLRVTDDVIAFSELLVTDLVDHGRHLVTKLDKLSKSHSEKVTEANFAAARAQGLLPDPADYSNWTTSFAKSRPIA